MALSAFMWGGRKRYAGIQRTILWVDAHIRQPGYSFFLSTYSRSEWFAGPAYQIFRGRQAVARNCIRKRSSMLIFCMP